MNVDIVGWTPPDDDSLATELAGLDRFLDEQGADRVHLYGHSAGGSVALAYAAERPDRVLSLALDEPASDLSEEDRRALREQFPERLEDLPAAHRMRMFVTSLVRPGIPASRCPLRHRRPRNRNRRSGRRGCSKTTRARSKF